MKKLLLILSEIKPEYDFTESQDFIMDGYLDSFDVVALVSAIEEEYGVLIDALDILPENFCNIDAILQIIKKNGGNIE